MDKAILRRLKELEKANPAPLLLAVEMPEGGTKTMRVDEYMELPDNYDFRFASGDNGIPALCDAGVLRCYLFKSVVGGKRFPNMESNGGLAAEDCISLVTALCARAPTRKLDDFN